MKGREKKTVPVKSALLTLLVLVCMQAALKSFGSKGRVYKWPFLTL